VPRPLRGMAVLPLQSIQRRLGILGRVRENWTFKKTQIVAVSFVVLVIGNGFIGPASDDACTITEKGLDDG
jgi:hypothetical protein